MVAIQRWIIILEIMLVTVLPIILLQANLVQNNKRIMVFGICFLIAGFSIVINRLAPEILGIETHNFIPALIQVLPVTLLIGLINLTVLPLIPFDLMASVDNTLSLWAYVAISIPIQQLIYYGYLRARFQQLTDNRVIIVVAIGILFGCMHIPWGNTFLVGVTTLLGLFWAYRYIKHPNLISNIIAHEIVGITLLIAFL